MTVPPAEEPREAAPPEKKVGPGPRLREAREAKRLSLEAAANQLRVDSALLRALEEDDYARFAAPIFVTGNLRAYARLLELAPEPLIEAYHQLGVDAPPPLKQVTRRLHFGSSSSLLPGVVLFLILVLAVILFVNLQNGGELEPVPEPPIAAAPEAEDGAAPLLELPLPAPPLAEPPADAAASAPPAAAPAPTEVAPRPPAAAGGRATLSLKADRASWVEVRDANRRRVLYDLLDPGSTRSVEGLAPFEVLLGYGPGVTVEFNGRLVDHSRYTRQDVARFRVGEDGVGGL